MNRIKQLRKGKNMTLVELGEKVNLPKGTLSRYENGGREPKEITWQALADFFNVSVDYLKGYGYSKDYIYKLLDDMYKEDWINPIVFKDGIGEQAFKLMKDSGERYDESIASSFFAKSTIQIYCENNKIKIPAELAHNFNNHDLSFWKNSFSFIFKNNGVNRLLTTKDKYTNDEIKELILSVIAQKNIGYTLKQALQKLSLNN
ncbi:helix-turn-helix domain-containing protein [Lactobacillus gallinarum]|uniref:helix-turn-helix domain-containing protein n=1 Tax=Lactobacillus gallinarum TaxID=52242 RepID=UPI00195AC50C|nr:helix-turn-helix domain-containing protein [Lactobacillus gallinarum]MBM6959124.1 helix-turn-helix transcriptional regulator [Lactobacillus gallinarum]